MLSDRKRKKAEEVLEDIQGEMTIILSGKGGEIHDTMEKFLEEIRGLSDKIRLEKGDGHPGFTVGGNIHYHALPLKNEFRPFLQTLKWLSGGATEI
jgi:alkyl hydroperoxide reductase subunit AhpF